MNIFLRDGTIVSDSHIIKATGWKKLQTSKQQFLPILCLYTAVIDQRTTGYK